MKDSKLPDTTRFFPTFGPIIRRGLFVLACLATLLALYYAEENWRGARAESDYRHALEARGESLDYRTFVPTPVPDNENFAGTPFFAPLFDFLPGTQRPRDTNAWQRTMDFGKDFLSVSVDGDWRAGRKLDLPAWAAGFEKAGRPKSGGTNPPRPGAMTPAQAAAVILEATKKYEPIFNEVRSASLRPHCRFNLGYDIDNPAGILMPHLARIKGICQMLRLRAAAELELGQTSPAARDVDLMIYLTDCVKSEPVLISQLVREANLQLTVQVIWQGLAEHKWEDAQLQAWQIRLQQFDFFGDLNLSLRAERAWGNRIIDWVKNDQNRADFYNALTNPESGAENLDASLYGLCPRGWFDLEKLNYNRLFEDFGFTTFNPQSRRFNPTEDAENAKRLEESLSGGLGVIVSHRLFARLLLPALAKVRQKFGFAQSTADLAIVACALERFHVATGHYPESLNALSPRFLDRIPNDVVSGAPLKYRRLDQGKFLLYSVGWNEKDDGGVVAMTRGKSPAADLAQGDWVWGYPEKAD
jgi:hypothetical protein